MAGEEQYINPIIQSMFQTAQNSQRAKEATEQARRNKAEEDLKQQQLEQEHERIKNEHQYQIDMLQTHHDQLANEINQAKIHSIGVLNDLRSRGIDLSKVFTSGQPQAGLPSTGNVQSPGSSISVPGLGDISPDAFTSPEQALQLKENEIRGTTQAQQSALQPYDFAKIHEEATTKEHLMGVQKTYDKELKQIELNAASHEKSLDRASQEKIANIHTAPEIQRINLEFGGGAPQLTAGLTKGILTGEIPPSDTNPLLRTITGSVINNGFVIPQKGDFQTMKAGEGLIPLFKKLEDYATKNLPSEQNLGKFGAGATATVQGLSRMVPIPTDAKNEFNQIKMQAMNVGRQLEGLSGGRIPLMVMQQALDGLTSPGITKEMAMSNLKNLKDMYTTKLQDSVMAGMPDAQRKLIYSSGITPPYLIDAAPTSNGLKLNREKSIKFGQPVYGGE